MGWCILCWLYNFLLFEYFLLVVYFYVYCIFYTDKILCCNCVFYCYLNGFISIVCFLLAVFLYLLYISMFVGYFYIDNLVRYVDRIFRVDCMFFGVWILRLVLVLDF